MYFKMIINTPLWAVFGLLSHVTVAVAITVPQLKASQQQTQQTAGQSTMNSMQQQQQHQQQHQQQQHVQVATQPQVSVNSNVLSDATAIATATTKKYNHPHFGAIAAQATTTQAYRPQAQFIHDNNKDDVLPELYKQHQQQQQQQQFSVEEELNDPYQLLNELTRDNYMNGNGVNAQPHVSHLQAFSSYLKNLYSPFHHMPPPPPSPLNSIYSNMISPYGIIPSTPAAALPITPRFLPIINYPQPIYMAYPFYMPSDMMEGNGVSPYTVPLASYPDSHEYEDSMSRAKQDTRETYMNRRLSTGYSPNSPIYYVRVPPTPYILFPSLNMIPYHSSSYTAMPSFSPIYNVPMNFLANGKPVNIYQMGGSPTDIQAHLQFPTYPYNHGTEHSGNSLNRLGSQQHHQNSLQAASQSQHYFNPFTAAATNANVAYIGSDGIHAPQESKLTNLKRPYYFNGRPEEMYVLQNHLKSSHASENNYY